MRAALLARRIAVAALALSVCRTVPAATLNVCPSGCPYSSIQAAVGAAASGDVIQIAAGRYVGNVTIEGKALTLVGASGGTPATEVVGIGGGPVFTLGEGSGSTSFLIEIHFLTITQGDHENGTGVGGGVQVRSGAYLHIFDSILQHNVARFGGGLGVNTPGGPASVVTHCLISDNAALVDNPAAPDGLGGGIELSQGSTLTVSQSTIARNQALDGGGVFASASTQLSLNQSDVTANQISQVHFNGAFIGGFGGGINAQAGLSVSNSVIAGNIASGGEGGSGGGLFVLLGEQAQLSNTTITHNLANGGTSNAVGNGGGIFTAAANNRAVLVLQGVYVVQNAAGQNGAGGIWNEGTLEITGGRIEDNSGLNCTGGFGCPP